MTETSAGRRGEGLRVRMATARDVGTLVDFNARLALETEGRRLDRERLRRGVLALLDRPGLGFYIVAEAEGQVVGSLMITYEWSDWRNGHFWWLQSVYVVPPWRRRGVFRTLFRHILEEAQGRGDVCGLRVYVDRDNEAARRTYQSMGMSPARYDLLEWDFVLAE